MAGPITTTILAKEDALRALDLATNDERRRYAVWYTDGSLLDGRAGGAAVRVEDRVEKERITVPLGEGQVCEGEMEGLYQATAKALRDGNTHIMVVSDSQAALRAILLTTPRSGQFRAIQYDRLVRDAQRSRADLAILNLWTPAHIGTIGNELADAAAKEATRMEADPSSFVSLTTVRRKIHLEILEAWATRWKLSKTGSPLRYIDQTPPSDRPILLYSSDTLTRKTSSVIAQLCTGPCPLNEYRFKAGFTDSPACDACGASTETRAHFILECPMWEPFRQPLHAVARAIGLYGPLHLSPLLSHPKLLKPFAKFIEATHRFD